jgi:hypothetical protein
MVMETIGRALGIQETEAQKYDRRQRELLEEASKPKTLDDVKAALAALEAEERELLGRWQAVAREDFLDTRHAAERQTLHERRGEIAMLKGHLGRRQRELQVADGEKAAAEAVAEMEPIVVKAMRSGAVADFELWQAAIDDARQRGAPVNRLPLLPDYAAALVRDHRRKAEELKRVFGIEVTTK